MWLLRTPAILNNNQRVSGRGDTSLQGFSVASGPTFDRGPLQ